jgi:hypothetical protein
VALSEQATVVYLCSTPYAPEKEHGVHPLDPPPSARASRSPTSRMAVALATPRAPLGNFIRPSRVP